MTVLAPATWVVDSQRAVVAFRGRANRFAPVVQARFTSVTGVLSERAVEVDVDVTSLRTGNSAYDEVLARLDPFDALRHPLATYRSEHVAWVDDRAVVDGVLTMRGRSAPVRLEGRRRDLDDGAAHLTATGRVARRSFGLGLDLPGAAAVVPAVLDLAVDVTARPRWA